MADSFDPYHKWLGISPKDQPPNHYRLLGVELFESDPDVIESAADQRMTHVRTFQTGQGSADSQRILNELSAAKLCLLEPQKKAAYDCQLRERLNEAAPPPVAPAPIVAPPPAPASRKARPQAAEESSPVIVANRGASSTLNARRKQPLWRQPAVLGVAGAAIVLAAAAWIVMTKTPPGVASDAKTSGRSPAAKATPTQPQAKPNSALPKNDAQPVANGTAPAPTNRQPPLARPSADRQIAEEAIQRGGKVRLLSNSNLVEADDVAQLPPADFDLVEVQILHADASQVADLSFLANAQRLEHLSLWDSRITAASLAPFRGHPTLKQLNLENTGLPSGALKQGLPLPQLEILLLAGCEIEGTDLADLADSKKLRVLGLQGAHITDDDLRLLEKFSQLRELILYSTPITDDGLALLANAAPALQSLIISATKVTDDGLRRLTSFKGLKQVDLAGNPQIRGEGLHWLKELPELEWLKLEWTSVNDESLRALGEFRGIHTLFLSHTNIGDAGLNHLSQLSALQYIALEGTQVTLSGAAKFKRTLPNCHVVFSAPTKTVAGATSDEAHEGQSKAFEDDPAEGKPQPAIDLLKGIDPERHAVAGEWRMEDGALVTPAEAQARLRIDHELPKSYDISLVAERLEGKGTLGLGLVLDGAQVLAAVDAFDGTITGLDKIDGKSCNENETTYRGGVLKDGAPNTLDYRVRPGHVQVVVNGEKLIDWRGDSRKLSNGFSIPDPPALYLAMWGARYRITKLELSPVFEESGIDMQRQSRDLAQFGKQPRLAAPDDDAQRKARLELQKRHSSKFVAAKSPDAKRALAEELIEKAAAAKPDADVYVALDQAIDLADSAGDLDLAWQACDELGAAFEFDVLKRRQQSLTVVGKSARSPQQFRDLADAACLLMADALAAQQGTLVKKVSAQAQSFAKRSKDPALTKVVAARCQDAGKLAGQIDDLAEALKALDRTPDDAGANFTVGHFQLCAARDREQGLRKLAKSADSGWKKLASDDLEASRQDATPDRRLALADSWLAQAEHEIWPGRHYLRMRAAEWYRGALPSLSGRERAHCIDQLKELLAGDEGLPAWELFDLERVEKRGTHVRIEPGGALRTCVEYDHPMDIIFVARTDSLNIRLSVHGYPSVIWNWEVNPSELRIASPDGAQTPVPTSPLEANRWYTFHYRVASQGTNITVDGVPVFAETKAYRKFPRSRAGLHGEGPAVIDVKKFVIKRIE